MGAVTPLLTARKPHHVRSASEPTTSSSPTKSSTTSASDNGILDDDAILADSSVTSSPIQDAIAPGGVNGHSGIIAHTFAENVLALGPRCVAYAMPSIKVTHHRLRAAQLIFPPEMCLFVGNLPASWDDGMLTRAVKYEFGKFGPCTVGVFRKAVSKPYAIVQYTDINDAIDGVYYGNGMWMERHLRVEFSARARY